MQSAAVRTRWGGLADGRCAPAGFFRTAELDGVFWLVDPDGGRFLSKGVNNVKFDPDQIQNSRRAPYRDACQHLYGSSAAWAAAAAARLGGWGFNTLGAWSDPIGAAHATPLAATPNLDLGMSFAWANNDRGLPQQHFPDVFDPAFAIHVDERARRLCAPHRADPHILGWFSDNELRWGPDWRGPEDLLTLFAAMPAGSPGHDAALTFLRQHHRHAPATASQAQHAAFAAAVAERYFALTAAAIRAADPSHLLLGCRFALPPGRAIVAQAARFVDVVSFNCYETDPAATLAFYAQAGKPCLIGEFSFRGSDAGLPNTRGAGPIVGTQDERAAAFRSYAGAAFGHPRLVGLHWFEHADQPAEGRFDGENSNFGVVTIEDRPYAALTGAMQQINAAAEALHSAAASLPAAAGAPA